MDGKQNPVMCCLQETHYNHKDMTVELKGWKIIFHINPNQKEIGTTLLILYKVDLSIISIAEDNV